MRRMIKKAEKWQQNVISISLRWHTIKVSASSSLWDYLISIFITVRSSGIFLHRDRWCWIFQLQKRNLLARKCMRMLTTYNKVSVFYVGNFHNNIHVVKRNKNAIQLMSLFHSGNWTCVNPHDKFDKSKNVW